MFSRPIQDATPGGSLLDEDLQQALEEHNLLEIVSKTQMGWHGQEGV